MFVADPVDQINMSSDRDAHFRDLLASTIAAASLGGYRVRAVTRAGDAVTGFATHRRGDAEHVLRIGETELRSEDVIEFALFAPEGLSAVD